MPEVPRGATLRKSREAPAFVPSWQLPKASQTRAPKLAFGSDTSTECGDSEEDDLRGSPKAHRSKARARSGSAS